MNSFISHYVENDEKSIPFSVQNVIKKSKILFIFQEFKNYKNLYFFKTRIQNFQGWQLHQYLKTFKVKSLVLNYFA